MNIEVKIPDGRIRDLIGSATIGYWAKAFQWISRESTKFELVEFEAQTKKHTVSWEMIRLGLTKMFQAPANKGGHHVIGVLDDTKADGFTGDAVVQFAVFGELKYG